MTIEKGPARPVLAGVAAWTPSMSRRAHTLRDKETHMQPTGRRPAQTRRTPRWIRRYGRLIAVHALKGAAGAVGAAAVSAAIWWLQR
nr:hypothetical protein [Streptomyces sp. TLI_235]